MKETLDWIIQYMTDNGLTDEEVQHFLASKHAALENRTVIEYLRDRNDAIPVKNFVQDYMLGM